jgi:hypothetical protein
MTVDDIRELSETERDEHLGAGGTGVLSLSTPGADPPRTIPVSYGYDAAETVFYFRLSVDQGTSDADFDDSSVSFVTYGDGDDGWWSIVATGRLEDIERAEIATETLDGLERVHIPLVDMFDAPPREVSFDFLRLVPDELTARREVSTEP